MRQRNFDQIYIYQPKMSQIQLIIKRDGQRNIYVSPR